MLFTFPKDRATTSLEARLYAITFLEREGFVDSRRFACPLADSYEIGGRWSGILGAEPQLVQDEDVIGFEGKENDAAVITPEIYDRLLVPYEVPYGGESDGLYEYVDEQYEELTRDAIGKKWVVIIGYHY